MRREYLRRAGRVQAHTDPALWPVCLRAAEVAAITRRSLSEVYRQAKRGTFAPMPVLTSRGEIQYPLRWHRDTVRAWVEGRA
jgi:predicted DNA-binding transcriptional regulator AlpA